MARARIIKPEAFLDEDLAALSVHARLLFIGLWTLADREGRLEDRPARIKAQLLPWDDVDAAALLGELEAPRAGSTGGFILRYASSSGRKLIQIRNFGLHQNPHPRETPSQLEAPAVEVHGEPCNYTASPGLSGTSRAVSVSVAVPSVPSAPSVAAAVPAAPPPATDQADGVAALEALAAEVAQLRAAATGAPADAEAELRKASATGSGRAFSRARDATPRWRAATRDRLLESRAHLLAKQRQSEVDHPARAALEAAAHDPPEARQRAENAWGLVLACVERTMGRPGRWSFATWCRPTQGLQLRGDELVVLVPNQHFERWLEAHAELVAGAVREAGLTCRVTYLAKLREAG